MRVRLNVARHELPATKILWNVSPEATTISKLLEQIHEVIPLESDGWGIEDYAVEVNGYEALHFVNPDSVLHEDDEVSIRALQTLDVRARSLSGRYQISAEGAHLIDGIPFGKSNLKRLSRPPIHIPSRKRARLTYNQYGDEGEEYYHDPEDDRNFQRRIEAVFDDADDELQDPEDDNIQTSSFASDDLPSARRLRSGKSMKSVSFDEDSIIAGQDEDEDDEGEEDYEPDGSDDSSDESESEKENEAPQDTSNGTIHVDADAAAQAGPRKRNPLGKAAKSTLSKRRGTERSKATNESTEGHTSSESSSSESDSSSSAESDAESSSSDDSDSSSGSESDATSPPTSTSTTVTPTSTTSKPVTSTEAEEPSNPTIPPGQGKKSTRARNIRRKSTRRNKFLELQAQKTQPAHDDAEPHVLNEAFEKRKQELLDCLANGGIDMDSQENSWDSMRTFESSKGTTKRRDTVSNDRSDGYESGQAQAGSENQESQNPPLEKSPAAGHNVDMETGEGGERAQPKRSTDPVILGLAKAASDDPRLKTLMQTVAAGGSTVEQLKAFQLHIHRIRKTTAKVEPEAKSHDPDQMETAAEPRIVDAEKAISQPEIIVSQDSPIDAEAALEDQAPEELPSSREVSKKARSRLDLAGSNRLIFGSLGVRSPKTKADQEKLRLKLAAKNDLKASADKRSSTQSQTATVPDHSQAETKVQDPDAWKSKIDLSAVECLDEDVTLSTPPFPFIQRWDPQQQSKGKKRKRGKQYDGIEETTDFDDSFGGGLNYDDVEEETLDDPSHAHVGDSQVEDLPSLPTDLSDLPKLAEDDLQQGAVIAFKSLECSAATNWQPGFSPYKTALIKSFSETSKYLELELAKRDCPSSNPEYDEEGYRVYGKYEMPIDEGDDGYIELSFTDLVLAKLLRSAPQTEQLEKDPSQRADGEPTSQTGLVPETLKDGMSQDSIFTRPSQANTFAATTEDRESPSDARSNSTLRGSEIEELPKENGARGEKAGASQDIAKSRMTVASTGKKESQNSQSIEYEDLPAPESQHSGTSFTPTAECGATGLVETSA